MSRGSSDLELVQQIHLLMQLGAAGAGGRLRLAYLRQRLADVTAGEVELGICGRQPKSAQNGAHRITESAMLAVISCPAGSLRNSDSRWGRNGWLPSNTAASATAVRIEAAPGQDKGFRYPTNNVSAIDRAPPSASLTFS